MKLVRLICMLMAGVPAVAYGGVETISTPSVTRDALEVEVGQRVQTGGDSEHAIQAMYGFTDWVKAGLEFTAERQRWNGDAADRTLRYSLTDLKSTFSFLKQSAAVPVSIGMRLQYGFSGVGGPDEIDARLLLRRQDGPLDLVANIGVEHEVGEDASPGFSGMGADLRGSVRYWTLASGQLAPAIDYLGSTGPVRELNGFDAQTHRLGPALYGSFKDGVLKDAAFDIGLLFGLSDATPDQTLKANLRYAF